MRGRLWERRDALLEIAAQHGARNVRVFGSVARGEHRTQSDIDLLVDIEPGVIFFTLARLCRKLSELLGTPVDVVSARALVPRDADALAEAIPLELRI